MNCPNCNGANIQAKIWINPNTGAYKGPVDEQDHEIWCDDCQEHFKAPFEESCVKNIYVFNCSHNDREGMALITAESQEEAFAKLCEDLEDREYVGEFTDWEFDKEIPYIGEDIFEICFAVDGHF